MSESKRVEPIGVSEETLKYTARLKAMMEEKYYRKMKEVIERKERQEELRQRMDSLHLDKDAKMRMMAKHNAKEKQYAKESRKKYSMTDFEPIKTIGRGAFGEVRVVRKKDDKQVYALKMMQKKEMVAKNQVTHIRAERNLLAAADNVWLVKLHYSFQDDTFLYLVMEYCAGGDLMTILMREDILSEPCTRFYMAELAMAIKSVHDLKFVHRDLKPDNVLVSSTGHIKLSDFGLAWGFGTREQQYISIYQERLKNGLGELPPSRSSKARKKGAHDRFRTFSTVGTPDYIAPEVFSQKGYGLEVDWWSLGVICFECLVGYPPFYAEEPVQICKNIFNYHKTLKIPTEANLSPQAKDLIKKLLCSSRKRLEFQGIREHDFFKDVGWDTLQNQKPPFIPNLKSEIDTQYFDEFDLPQPPPEKFKPKNITDKGHFMNFTYVRRNPEAVPSVAGMFEKEGNIITYIKGCEQALSNSEII